MLLSLHHPSVTSHCLAVSNQDCKNNYKCTCCLYGAVRNDLRRSISITRAIGRGGPWKSRLYVPAPPPPPRGPYHLHCGGGGVCKQDATGSAWALEHFSLHFRFKGAYPFPLLYASKTKKENPLSKAITLPPNSLENLYKYARMQKQPGKFWKKIFEE